VRSTDTPPDEVMTPPAAPTVEVTESRDAIVGAQRVRRALPIRTRRTIGAWCFIDHMGPGIVADPAAAGIGPHPHIGLQTVTWLTAGELLHRDTLGSEQTIRPGQLNLMTAGHGVAHAEEPTSYRSDFHGVQLWVAQPERTRHSAPAFEHHGDLPQVELDRAAVTVLVGDFDSQQSPARRDTNHVGLDLQLRPGASTLPANTAHEYGLVVLDGAVSIDSIVVEPGRLAYLGLGRDELTLDVQQPTRALVVGGERFESPILMWWNFVARTHAEVDDAQQAWNDHDDRFGEIDSVLPRIPAPVAPWTAPSAGNKRSSAATR
jgi:quercetin 2,3-dioxygenase